MHDFDILTIRVTPFRQNCTIIFNKITRKAILIDPGGGVAPILRSIAESKLDIEAIWITHGHIDHAGAAMEMRERLRVNIVGPHKADEPLLARLADTARDYNFKEPVQNCYPDLWLEEGDSVYGAGHEFAILHCPGHSPGHVVYFSKTMNLAIVGDVLFRGSIGRTDFPGCSHQQLMHSIQKKILPLGDQVHFLCGHGLGGTIGEERLHNPFLQGLCP